MSNWMKAGILLCIIFPPFALVWLLWLGLKGLGRLVWWPFKKLKRQHKMDVGLNNDPDVTGSD